MVWWKILQFEDDLWFEWEENNPTGSHDYMKEVMEEKSSE